MKKLIIIVIITLFSGCTHENSVEPLALNSLEKSNSSQYYLGSAINLTPDLSSSYGISEACGNSFIPANQYSDGSDIVLELDQGVPGHAQVVYETGGLKYYSFKANVTYELPIGDPDNAQRLRAAIWLKGTNYSNDLNNNTCAAPFEIFTNDENENYKITYSFAEYWEDSEREVNNSSEAEFNNSVSSTYFVNAEYRIDWHPRYAEFFVNQVSVAKFDHSYASPEYMDPRISFYWIPTAANCSASAVPSKTYTMRVHSVEVRPYLSIKSFSLNGLELGSVNFKAKRFCFDNDNNGILDDFYFSDEIEEGDIPLVGNFSASSGSEIGFYRPSDRQFFIDKNGDGDFDDNDEVFTYGALDDIPVVGDWNGDGYDTPGIFRPSTKTFWLSDDRIGQPVADYSVRFGDVTDYPIVGDWDGDGKDNVGVYRKSEKRFWQTLSMSGTGTAFQHIDFGEYSGDQPIIGDWDGNGVDNVGVYRTADRQFHLTTSTWGSATTTAILDMDDEGTYGVVGF